MMTWTVLGLLTTKLTDTLRNAFDSGNQAPKVVWNLTAFGLGITLAFIFGVNALAGFAGTKLAPAAGKILTGLGMGGVAGLGHEGMAALSRISKRP